MARYKPATTGERMQWVWVALAIPTVISLGVGVVFGVLTAWREYQWRHSPHGRRAVVLELRGSDKGWLNGGDKRADSGRVARGSDGEPDSELD